MRLLLILLAVLSGLVLPEMAAAQRAQVAGMRTALQEEPVASPVQEACIAARAQAPHSDPSPDAVDAPFAILAGVQRCGIALTDRPLE